MEEDELRLSDALRAASAEIKASARLVSSSTLSARISKRRQLSRAVHSNLTALVALAVVLGAMTLTTPGDKLEGMGQPNPLPITRKPVVTREANRHPVQNHSEIPSPTAPNSSSPPAPLISDDSASSEAPAPACGFLHSRAPTPTGVEVTIQASADTIKSGDSVSLKLTVRNNGVIPVDYTNGGPRGQRYDFWASNDKGIVWAWGSGKVFQQPLAHNTLAPGEEVTATEIWDQSQCAAADGGNAGQLDRGNYFVRALWVAGGGPEGGTGWWSNTIQIQVQ